MNTAGYATPSSVTTTLNAAPDAEHQIPSALSALHEANSRADMHLLKLMDRIGVVVRPPLHPEGAEIKAVRPDMSPLAEELWTAAGRVNDLADTIARLGERIDL